MAWRAYFETASGRLISIGSIDPPEIPADISAIDLPGPPDWDSQMWDEITRAFVTRPIKVIIDRLEDMLTNPNYADWVAVWNNLNATRKAQVRNVLIRLLGSQRYRAQGERTEL